MYITDLKAISSQLTYKEEFLKGELVAYDDKVYNVIEPDYIEFIPKGLLRRMGKAVRMGVGTGLPLVKENNDIDAIIMGTANGGLEDCIKFLNQIVEYDEGVLTPTNFVQSTPNAVAGQLALMGQCKGYNTTYTNGGLAFENALLDGLLLFQQGACSKILLGGIEEISDYNYNIDSLVNKYKETAVKNSELIDATTPGTVCGEGACMFIMERNPKNYYAKIEDVGQITYPNKEDLAYCMDEMLKRNKLNRSDIDTVMLGLNGDINHNDWYTHVSEDLLPEANTLSFKNLIGDYRTCTSFAVWLAAHLLKGNTEFIETIQIRKSHSKKISRILIYNHFDAVRHGFILLSA